MRKFRMLIIVILLSIFAKILEWLIQLFSGLNPSVFFLTFTPYIQLAFITLIAIVLYVIFDYLIQVKKEIAYLSIPAIAYFIKELFNFIVVLKFNFNTSVFIALFIEPIVLYLLILGLNAIFRFAKVSKRKNRRKR